MRNILIIEFLEQIKSFNPNLLIEKDVKKKTILLKAGKIASNIYFVKKGCLRIWYNNDGKEVTVEFFFENSLASSFESFIKQEPSIFSIELLEDSVILELSKKNYDHLIEKDLNLKNLMFKIVTVCFTNIIGRLLSLIKNSPQERYDELLKTRPELLHRIPQYYIASYLGITSVSLSRIRGRE